MAFNFYEENGIAKKNDLRSQVSQRIIWDAMFSLLSEKPFDSVHVKDICNRAKVNRSTFYNHFADKYELLQFGLHEVILKEAGITVDQGPLTQLPHPMLFQYVYKHQEFWKNVFGTPRARDFVDETIIESSESFFTGANPEDIPAALVARMYFGAIGSLTMWWLSEDCKTPIAQLNAWVDSVWKFGGPL